MKKIKVRGVVKGVLSFGAGMGAARIAKFAIEKVVPEVVSKTDNVLIIAGSAAIGAMVSSSVGDFVGEFVDDIFDITEETWSEMKKEVERQKVAKEQEVKAA